MYRRSFTRRSISANVNFLSCAASPATIDMARRRASTRVCARGSCRKNGGRRAAARGGPEPHALAQHPERHSGCTCITALMLRSAWRSFAALSQRATSAPLRPGVLRFTAVAGAVAALALSSPQTALAAPSSTQASSSSSTSKALNIKLYGYNTCPFCNKVGSFLDFFQVPYTLVQVNPIYKDELAFSPDYQKVPIVVLNGERLIDSDSIIDRLNSEVSKQRQTQYVYNDCDFGKEASFVRVSFACNLFLIFSALHFRSECSARPLETTDSVQKWRAWVNSHLVHVLVSNVYRTPSECLEVPCAIARIPHPLRPRMYRGPDTAYSVLSINFADHVLSERSRIVFVAQCMGGQVRRSSGHVHNCMENPLATQPVTD